MLGYRWCGVQLKHTCNTKQKKLRQRNWQIDEIFRRFNSNTAEQNQSNNNKVESNQDSLITNQNTISEHFTKKNRRKTNVESNRHTITIIISIHAQHDLHGQ